MMLKKSLKSLFSHSALYSLTWVSSSLASILLLPVYTHYLTKTDYGILEILTYTNTILRIILIASFHTALGKFFHAEEKPERQRLVVSTSTSFVLIFGGIGCLIGTYFWDAEFAKLLLGDSSYAYYINLNFAILYVEMAVTISVTYFIVSKKPKIYVIYSIFRLILAITLNLYFIVGLELGALGMLFGNIIAMGISAVIVTFHNFYINGVKIDIEILKDFWEFSLPMIPAMLCATAMHNADRFLIRYYCDLSDVGIYSLGYKFPFMLNALVLQSFNRVWSGSAMYEIAKQPDSRYQYTKIATYFMALFVFAQFALSVFSVTIIRIFADAKFFEAHMVIPPVALGISFHAFYTFFTVGAYVKNKTWLLIFSYLPAAAVNIAGNMFLLPRYGYMTAAWMTVATYLVFSVIAYFTCQKLLNISYEFRRLISLFLCGILIYVFSSLIIFDNFFIEIAKEAGFILLFPLLLFFGGWLMPSEKEQLKAGYHQLRKKLQGA